jgi:hypothetical protein
MNACIYTGTVISELMALIEKRICIVPDCDHLGQSCAECKVHVCKIHSEKCTDCGQIHCEDCAAFHGMYCEKAKGEAAGEGTDPVHDHRRDAVREVQR